MTRKERLAERIENATCPLFIRWGFAYKGAKWRKTTKKILLNTLKEGDYVHYDGIELDKGFGVSFYTKKDIY